MLSPVGAQLIQRRIVNPRVMLFGAFTVVGLAFLHFSRMNLATDYRHWALARAMQGAGMAFFFVPLSLLTYSERA